MKIFETFAGIGAQHKALKNLKEEGIVKDFEAVGISEWYISAIIAYSLIHHNKDFQNQLKEIEKKYGLNEVDPKVLKKNEKEFKEYVLKELEEETFSTNSKDPANLSRVNTTTLKQLYVGRKVTKNLGSVMGVVGEELPKGIDVLTYSFPCQDLSAAGKKRGLERGTRSGLLWEIGRIINETPIENRPNVLLMENVPTLFNKFAEGWNVWKEELKQLGYVSYDITLNSKEFNMAQHRRRAFSIALKVDQFKEEELENFDIEKAIENTKTYTKYQKEIDKNGYAKIKDILDTNIPPRYYINKPFNILKSTDGSTGVKFDLIDHSSYEIANRIYDTNFGSPTLTTSGQIKIYDDEEKKKLRAIKENEAFKLMGFDQKDFDLVEKNFTKGHLYRFAGNSIAVNVLEGLFEVINGLLEQRKK